MENTTNRQHHPFSPSRLQLFAYCPGAYRMQYGLPDVSTPESNEGTRIHEAIATGDLSNLNPAETELAQGALEFLEAVKSGNEMGCEIFKERPVKVVDLDGKVLTEGTADVIVKWEDGRLEVIDWKFGYKAVPVASENIQTAAYALAAMQEYGASECLAHIWQPRLKRHSVYTFRKPEAILANIRGIVSKCQSEKVTLNPGDWCANCKAFEICPAARGRMEAVVPASQGNGLPSIPTDPEKLADLWERCRLAERFIGKVKATLLEQLEANNGQFGRYKLQIRQGARKCADIAAFYKILSPYLTQEEFLCNCSVSVSSAIQAAAMQMQDLRARGDERCTVKECRELLEDRLAEYITRGEDVRTITEVKEA